MLAADNVDAPDERADALEVVFAIAADLSLEPIQLEKLREAKAGADNDERVLPVSAMLLIGRHVRRSAGFRDG